MSGSACVAAKLRAHTHISPSELTALDDLVQRPLTVKAGETIAAMGDPLDQAAFVLDGVACRHKTLPDGRKQILSFLLPGDMVDMHASLLRVRDDNLEAVSPCQVVLTPQSRVSALATAHPNLGAAFLREAMIEGAIAREWVLNLGRRTALEGLAHLLCELKVRMDAVGWGGPDVYPLHIKQQQLADALGLSPIHMNRSVKRLTQTGFAHFGRRQLIVSDFAALARLAHFDPSYLHLLESVAA
jgi:CRP-like cAMP-binding protein